MPTDIIYFIAFAYCVITSIIITMMYRYNGNFYFNPIENYDDWENLNGFAVVFFTIIINIIFLPYAIVYWVLKFFKFIFTVGRV